jgi:chemotaxis methyl-accepting protein methylase
MAFTYFFRDLHTLQHITREVIPVTSGRSRVRLWDAGCAMGQEAYSLAIILAENLGPFAFKNLRISATDKNMISSLLSLLERVSALSYARMCFFTFILKSVLR